MNDSGITESRGALTICGRCQALEDSTGGAVLPQVCRLPAVHEPLLQERHGPMSRNHTPWPQIRHGAAPALPGAGFALERALQSKYRYLLLAALASTAEKQKLFIRFKHGPGLTGDAHFPLLCCPGAWPGNLNAST